MIITPTREGVFGGKISSRGKTRDWEGDFSISYCLLVNGFFSLRTSIMLELPESWQSTSPKKKPEHFFL